jgi:coproporphyrinogen III oxidase-like Fe-S oxidoreductase
LTDETYGQTLVSLRHTDPAYPVPAVVDVLGAPENRHLLEYVTEDPFGAHVFPGNVSEYPVSRFLADLDEQLADTAPIHLWAYVPTCAYRCHFCQYPVVIARDDDQAVRWVDWNLREARLWLRHVPHLASAPIGEFNIFGGTPSLLPGAALDRLISFYRDNFHFGPDTAVRIEGDPTTLTMEKLKLLADLGCTKVSCGIQSFDDEVLRSCGREHTAALAMDFMHNAKEIGFERISVDLMYGLLDQTVDSVRRDLDLVLAHGVTAVVCTKLHLRSFTDTRTGVAGVPPAAWQRPDYRDRQVEQGHSWPSLGQTYQMREVLAQGLQANGHTEHPTTYFTRAGHPPEAWKSMMVDQDRQEAEVAIGLGGSSSCRKSEAIAHVNWRRYVAEVEADRIPLESATHFSVSAREARAVKMALSSLQPLTDRQHRDRFAGRSLFADAWPDRFRSLVERGLLTVDESAATIALTGPGKTLVEAIINTEL